MKLKLSSALASFVAVVFLGRADLAAADPGNSLRLTARSAAPGAVALSFAAQDAQSYSLLYRTTLGPGLWALLAQVPASTNRGVQYVDVLPADTRTRFYAVVSPALGGLTVNSVWPLEGAAALPANTVVIVNFASPVNSATVTTNSFALTDDLGRAVGGQGRWSLDARSLTFTPDLPLTQATTYQVSLSGAVQDTNGVALSPTKRWTFSTTTSADLTENRAVYLQDGLTVAEIHLKLWLQPGGYTMADVDNTPLDSTNPPTIDVHFQEGAFGQNATNINGALRLRGHSVRFTAQKSYRVDLIKGAGRWRGHKVINLNKHPYDLTRVRNKLSFDLFKALPHFTSLRTLFTHLFLDDVDYGFFTQVEQPDKDALSARGLDPNGQLYKANFFEWYRYPDVLRARSDPKYDEAAFNVILEMRGRPEHEKLLRMLEDVNNYSIPINQVIARHFDRDNYLTWFAVNILMDNLDTASQNYFLYSSTTSSTWYFLPWDYDGAWGFYEQPNEAAAAFLSRWQSGLPNWWGGVLHQRFLMEPGNAAAVLARASELASNLLDRTHLQDLLNRYHDIVQPYISTLPDRRFLPLFGANTFLTQWQTEYTRVGGVVEQKYGNLLATFARPMPVFLGDPRASQGGLLFNWGRSFSLLGNPVVYDFQVSAQPDFVVPLVSLPGLTGTSLLLNGSLPSGPNFWRVIIRDATNPSANWQVAFDKYWVPLTTTHYDGVRQFIVP